LKIYKIVLESDYFKYDKIEKLVVAEDIAKACAVLSIPVNRHISGVGLIGNVDAIQEEVKEPQYITTWARVDQEGNVTTGPGENSNVPQYTTNNVVSNLVKAGQF
jgi:hypothetical protein